MAIVVIEGGRADGTDLVTTVPVLWRPDCQIKRAWLGGPEHHAKLRELFGDRLPIDYDDTLGENSIVFLVVNAFGRADVVAWEIQRG